MSNTINTNINVSQNINLKTAQTKEKPIKLEDPKEIRQDRVDLNQNENTKSQAYSPDQKEIDAIKLDFTKNVNAFEEMVRSLLEKQGVQFTNAFAALKSKDGGLSIKVDQETQEKAVEAISEDGYWGVKKTSERIVGFAKALSGGDKSKIESLKNAFLEGFKEAEKAFGGELPEISQKTYDSVLEAFDQWEKES